MAHANEARVASGRYIMLVKNRGRDWNLEAQTTQPGRKAANQGEVSQICFIPWKQLIVLELSLVEASRSALIEGLKFC